MKVEIYPYRNHWSSTGVEKTYFKIRYPDKNIFTLDGSEYDLLDRSVVAFLDLWDSTINRAINKLKGKFPTKKDRIRIDSYDTWNLDSTLSKIIYPALLEIKKNKQGSPFVDDKDVPKHLKSTSAPPKENDWDTDDNHHLRWDYVLNEMIWAFGEIKEGYPGEDAFHHNRDNVKITFEPYEDKPGYTTIKSVKKDESKPDYWVDKKGLASYHKKIKKGTTLFGKYYGGLWT